MTDVANVQWPDDMVVDNVTFKEGWTQARDEFGMGFIKFDKAGKITVAEYLKSCYGGHPANETAYNENIKSFTGILNMIDFAIVAIKGQLVFGFGVAFPAAVSLLTMNYKTVEYWEDAGNHFASLKENDIEHFEKAINHYVNGLNKPLTEKLKIEDLIDDSNPLRTKLIPITSGFKDEEDMNNYWVALSEEIRLYYQTGDSEEDHYGLYNDYTTAPIKHRQLSN